MFICSGMARVHLSEVTLKISPCRAQEVSNAGTWGKPVLGRGMGRGLLALPTKAEILSEQGGLED